MTSYADTSFLASLYLMDFHATAAASAMRRARLPFLVTSFGRFELANAISLRLFRKEVTLSQLRGAFRLLEEDLADGVLSNAGMPVAIFERAEMISRRQTPKLGTRTLDVLHVASALVLRATVFYTFDQRQATLASSEGLRVL